MVDYIQGQVVECTRDQAADSIPVQAEDSIRGRAQEFTPVLRMKMVAGSVGPMYYRRVGPKIGCNSIVRHHSLAEPEASLWTSCWGQEKYDLRR